MNSESIKKRAAEIGFSQCGIAKAVPLQKEQLLFEEMIAQNRHAGRLYLERDTKKRFDPESYLSGCSSVIVCLYNYYTGTDLDSDYKMGKYTFISDYHILIKEKLETLATFIHQNNPEIQYRTTVDTSPVSEKNWAVKAGLGSIGKNAILQTPHGSYNLIGLILTQLPLAYCEEKPIACGSCTRCIDACPTKAIVNPYQVDANRCISHHNTEIKIKERSDFENDSFWIYGCDVCQDVCPNNQNPTINPDALLHFSLFLHFKNSDFEQLNPDRFARFFGSSCIQKKKYDRFQHEIDRVKILIKKRNLQR